MGIASDEMLVMSKNLTGLAGDMASFYNLTGEDAFAKIRAGISGETEPLTHSIRVAMFAMPPC